MNTTTRSSGNLLGALASNAAEATTSVANTAIKAANVVSDFATDGANSLFKAVNSVTNGASTTTRSNSNSNSSFSLNSLIPFGNTNKGKNNSSTTTLGANAASLFSNVTNANMKSANAALGLPSETPWWAIPLGIFVVLVGIFTALFVLYKNEITLAYNNIVTSVRNFLGYGEPKVTMPPPSADVTQTVPSATQAVADGQMKSLVEKVLPLGGKGVFNVSANDFSYYDAEPLCNALGAQLATYDQVKDAWEKGADWCNYGWVKGQVAVYPTQKDTFEKLQQGPEDERYACGTPGVNGGYFDNPEMKFGVNCYGSKPTQTAADERLLMEKGTIPRTPATLKMDQQIQMYKDKVDQLGVLPFSDKQWSSS